jgi:hypothetical protein
MAGTSPTDTDWDIPPQEPLLQMPIDPSVSDAPRPVRSLQWGMELRPWQGNRGLPQCIRRCGLRAENTYFLSPGRRGPCRRGPGRLAAQVFGEVYFPPPTKQCGLVDTALLDSHQSTLKKFPTKYRSEIFSANRGKTNLSEIFSTYHCCRQIIFMSLPSNGGSAWQREEKRWTRRVPVTWFLVLKVASIVMHCDLT